MDGSKALASSFFPKAALLAALVCFVGFAPAARAQNAGAPDRMGGFGARPAAGHVAPRGAAPGGAHRGGEPAAATPRAPVAPAEVPRGQQAKEPVLAPKALAAPPLRVPRAPGMVAGTAERSPRVLSPREPRRYIPIQGLRQLEAPAQKIAVVPGAGGTLRLTWPGAPVASRPLVRPLAFRPAAKIARAGKSIAPQPVSAAPRRFLASRSRFAAADPGAVSSLTQVPAGQIFFGDPLFCDGFGFCLFGFNPFFFGNGFCPLCSPQLGLPLLSVNGLAFGSAPSVFFPFDRRPFFDFPFFGSPFFRHRRFHRFFFGGPFFFAEPFFFSGFVSEVESEQVASAPAGPPEPDPAIIPSNQVWGGPSDAESMAAAPAESSAPVTLLVLKDGSVYSVVDYWLGEDWRVHYLTTYGGKNSVPLDQVDVMKSVQVNMVLGRNFILESRPHGERR